MKKNSLIDRTLANFQVKRLIGRGGMAEVYYGWDVKLHRPVAIKVFDVRSRANLAQANRFIQEARTMAKWRHDHIVPIYSAGDETGLFYYVMEFIDGYDLASIMSVYVEKGELMPIPDALRIGDSIASALDYAHEQGVIHRDVKPANVMIANDGRVVLGDFGLALDINDKSKGEVFGSPHYISPEQARRSSDALPQSDLYSLGVILYEILTGATPFNDPSPASLALQHITEPPPPPRNLNPNLSKNVEDVILKALEKKPADRYQSGKSLMEALREAFAAKPVTAPADAPPLPPIPVNAPIIRRSDISLNSFTKRRDIITALEKKSTTTKLLLDDELSVPRQSSKRRTGWLILFGFLLLLTLGLGLKFRPQLFAFIYQPPPASSSPVAIANTEQMPVPIPSTETPAPEPSSTQTIVIPTLTTTPTVLSSATATHTQTIASTEPSTASAIALATTSPTPTVIHTSTAKYPDGYLMTAYYNESSFYILNKGKGSRSVSGFVFERVNNDGAFQDHFGGWEWEKNFRVIQPRRCVILEIDHSPIPYLNPIECEKKTLSNLGLALDSDKLFWTPSDNSLEFRVLWLNEEIARCEIKAGTCDFYVP